MPLNSPDFFRPSVILLGLIGFVFVMYIAQDIIVPLTLALIIAILLNPVVNFLTRFHFNRVLAIACAILMMFILIVTVFYFIGRQVSVFAEALPELKKRALSFADQSVDWAARNLKIPEAKIKTWIDSKRDTGMEKAGAFLGNTLMSLTSTLFMAFLLPVYIFLFLFYKPLLLEFVAKLFRSERHGQVAQVLFNTKTLIQSYLVGLLIEAVIVATLNSIVLLIIGVPYAIVFGVMGAVLNIIPYIGGVVSTALPMLMAFIGDTPSDAWWVLVGYIIVQLIDNNFLVPVIVASKVEVNALVSIVVVLIGGSLWGVAGMFLSIPLTALAKVVFDRIESLKPLGLLIGDHMPKIGEDIFHFHILQKAHQKKKTDEQASSES